MAPTLRYRIGNKAALELATGDITYEPTDAIVNAANSSLLGGGGVDGAIHRAAGPALLQECKRIREQRGPLPAGQAVSTSGANLKARYVIHTVGPVWQGGTRNEPQVLESCYCHALEEASRRACSSVSFPSISTGAFGYPVEAAARIAVQAVADILHAGSRQRTEFAGPGAESPQPVMLVRFVLFDDRTHDAYARAAEELALHSPHLQMKREPVPS
jgi:O-acetyl-ADP-ribose deacetylase (regulator of RNase III)